MQFKGMNELENPSSIIKVNLYYFIIKPLV
jgi:hypothetical protein